MLWVIQREENRGLSDVCHVGQCCKRCMIQVLSDMDVCCVVNPTECMILVLDMQNLDLSVTCKHAGLRGGT